MSTEAKQSYEEAIKEGQTFGSMINALISDYWDLKIDEDVESSDYTEEDKQAVYDWVRTAIDADECFKEEYPDFSTLFDGLLDPETACDEPTDEELKTAEREGVDFAIRKVNTLRDNPYTHLFYQERYLAWRTSFVKTRNAANIGEDDADQSSEPEAEQAVETVEPTLTKQQLDMLDIDDQLIDLNPRVRSAQNLVDSLKSDLKEAKSDLDELLEEQVDLCNQLALIDGGGYQNNLPFDAPHPDVEAGKNRPHGTPALDAVAKAVMKVDPAKTANISELGLTEKETDKLINGEINTIADLESRMRNDEWWHRKIDKVGPKTVDKISDALLDWRMKNPIPSDDEEDEPEEVAEAEEPAEEVPDTIPMSQDETGNQKIGFGCPDANELGVIVRNYEEVPIIDNDGVRCLVQVYEVPDGGWISCIDIQDTVTPYMFSNTMNIEDYTSSSRDAAIWNQLSSIKTEDTPADIIDDIGEYVRLHLSKMEA